MERFSYELFLNIFNKGKNIDETVFYFADDPESVDRYLGYLPQDGDDEPYWAGYCDFPNGFSCRTAEELLNAKIYDGKSLAERWDTVRIVSICGEPVDAWLISHTNMHVNGMVTVRFVGIDDPLAMRRGKIYDARVLKPARNGVHWFGVVDETGEEYAYAPKFFELVGGIYEGNGNNK